MPEGWFCMADCAIIKPLTYRGILAMLDQTFGQVYTKFKLHFYKQIFSRFEDREATLTTVESFCMEVIMALGEPTIAQFSHMMNLSTPNAAYKINSLVKKGYVERIRSTTDKREYRLRPTQKYIDYYNISYSYLHLVMERAKQRFSPDDLAKLEEMLQVVSDELMPEIQLPE
jgi:DNA-binding MarR family transcriptional regulator